MTSYRQETSASRQSGEKSALSQPPRSSRHFAAISVAGIVIVLASSVLFNMGFRGVAASAATVYPANVEYDGRDMKYGQYQTASLTNPNITGVDVIMNWSDVEPQPGSFNWGPADNEMAAWSNQGKKFVMVVRYTHKLNQTTCDPTKQWMPVWEQNRIPTLCSTGEIVPDYYDATFQSDLANYIQAIAQHVAASPYASHFEYIRIGLGFAGEGYPCLGCDATAWQTLTNWGYTPHSWALWQEQMLTAYHEAISPYLPTPIIYALGNNTVDPITNQPIAQEVAYWAAPQGFGAGSEGLHSGLQGTAITVMTYIHNNYPDDYLQFQTVTYVSGTSDLQGDIDIANNVGAKTIEWYGKDTIQSAYQPYFQQWQQTINNEYGTPTPALTQTSGATVTPPATVTVTPTITPTSTPTSTPTETPTPSPSPAPSLLAQDTFQRPNQALWGMASDGHVWGGVANRSSAFAISNNTGRIAPTSSLTNSAVLGSAATNVDVLMTFSASSITTSNTIGTALRYASTSMFYRAFVDGGRLWLSKNVNGTVTKLKSVSFTASANTSYTLRFEVTASTLAAKIWQTAAQEPAGWMVTTTDTSLSGAGNAAIRVALTAGVTVLVARFQATQL